MNYDEEIAEKILRHAEDTELTYTNVHAMLELAARQGYRLGIGINSPSARIGW